LRIPDSSTVDAARNLQSAASPAKATAHAPAPESVQDEVTIGNVTLAAANAIDAPESRIAELRQQILDGTYKVDAHSLSSKIIDEHLDK
jgi:anti-sigma28 factor (negative regulator of flagellin synthesis)